MSFVILYVLENYWSFKNYIINMIAKPARPRFIPQFAVGVPSVSLFPENGWSWAEFNTSCPFVSKKSEWKLYLHIRRTYKDRTEYYPRMLFNILALVPSLIVRRFFVSSRNAFFLQVSTTAFLCSTISVSIAIDWASNRTHKAACLLLLNSDQVFSLLINWLDCG